MEILDHPHAIGYYLSNKVGNLKCFDNWRRVLILKTIEQSHFRKVLHLEYLQNEDEKILRSKFLILSASMQ